jgi:hypothetical protein
MMPEKYGKRYTPRFKFQGVMKILSGTKAVGQIARARRKSNRTYDRSAGLDLTPGGGRIYDSLP